MFELENVATLLGALLSVFIIIFQVQRNALKRAAIEHEIEMIELARNLKTDDTLFARLLVQKLNACSQRKCSFFSYGFFWQFLFGIVLFICFTSLTLSLLGSWLAVLTGIFALLGLLIPFEAWRENRQINRELERLRGTIESCESTLLETAKAPQQVAEPPRKVAEVEAQVQVAATAKRIPEDSMLKRHFLANLRSEIEAACFPRPTDLTLRRHYDAMINAAVEQRLEEYASD